MTRVSFCVEEYMPKDTFFRLPEEKKERILQAAVREFSSVIFTDASINRIIREAQIPRGSFYQYFEGKEDLYLYLIEYISEEKREIFSRYMEQTKGGFFETIEASVPAVFQWARERPEYYRIGYFLLQDQSEFIRNLVKRMDTAQAWMYGLLKADQQDGKIRPDVDLHLVMDMYLAMSNRMLQLFYEGTQEDAVVYIRNMLNLFRYGICTEQISGKEQR